MLYQKYLLPLFRHKEVSKMSTAELQKELKVFSALSGENCGIEAQLFAPSLPQSLAEASSEQGVMFICHSGSARLIHSGVEHTLRTRDMVILFPSDLYAISELSADFTLSWCSFSKQAVREQLSHLPSTFFKHIATTPISNLENNSHYELFMGYIKMIALRSEQSNNICRVNIIQNLFVTLFLEVLNRVAQSFEADTSDPKHRDYILSEFIEMVEATPRCREVAYFAQRLSVSPKQLSAIVADGTGYGAKEFIERNAIAQIKHLLSTTDLKVKQIATRLGFTESGNMCRFFKSNTGQTISDFKSKCKG